MADTIPPDIFLKVEQTLAQWQQWDCQPKLMAAPPLIKPLSGGQSNYSALVGIDHQYVVRIDGKKVSANSLSRSAEWSALHSAYQAGIGPRPCYFNPDLGALVCDYHEPDKATEPTTKVLADLLRAIHKLATVRYRLDLRDRVETYERQLDGREVDQLTQTLRKKAQLALGQLSYAPTELVLCHNDLLAANRVNTASGLLAIDWEYCAMGSRWFELAVVVNGDKMDSDQTDTLLEAYLQRPATAAEKLNLEQYGLIYQYLEKLWYLANE